MARPARRADVVRRHRMASGSTIHGPRSLKAPIAVSGALTHGSLLGSPAEKRQLEAQRRRCRVLASRPVAGWIVVRRRQSSKGGQKVAAKEKKYSKPDSSLKRFWTLCR
jgi:hypothetical protein